MVLTGEDSGRTSSTQLLNLRCLWIHEGVFRQHMIVKGESQVEEVLTKRESDGVFVRFHNLQ